VLAADNSDNDIRAARSGGSSYFLSGGGEMGAIMRAYDWSQSALGLPEKWPQSLRTVVRLMLNTGHPMYVGFGAGFLPAQHQGVLLRGQGDPVRLQTRAEVWDEIWPIIGPQIEQVMSGRGATACQRAGSHNSTWAARRRLLDVQLQPDRRRHGSKRIGGVLVVCTETTQQVLASRQIATERDRLAQLFEQAPTFMTMLRGPEHRFELANPSYMQLIGHRPVLGRTIAEALPEVVAQGYLELLDAVFRSGEAYSATSAKFEVQALPGGPTVERFVDFVYQPIKDQLGGVTGIFVVGADVTDRARSDAALRDSESRLRETAEKLRGRCRQGRISRDLGA
jgi:PAS domain-containing protein